eukprot:SAG31_NODE_3386_length_4331_cov_2.421786_7_plen_166_part_00
MESQAMAQNMRHVLASRVATAACRRAWNLTVHVHDAYGFASRLSTRVMSRQQSSWFYASCRRTLRWPVGAQHHFRVASAGYSKMMLCTTGTTAHSRVGSSSAYYLIQLRPVSGRHAVCPVAWPILILFLEMRGPRARGRAPPPRPSESEGLAWTRGRVRAWTAGR